MKSLLIFTLLLTTVYSADIWTPFANEEGELYDKTAAGVELSQFGAERGGNGGGPWTDDCENKGNGIAQIRTECGRYTGSVQLRCANGAWLPRRGAGLGNGHGPTTTFPGAGITKVLIKAGGYVDSVFFYKGTSLIKRCGYSNGGGAYVANAPAGHVLCGLKGRAGWWLDRLSAGWCRTAAAATETTECNPPLNVAKSGMKADFNSRNAGDQIRKWFDGAALKANADKIVGSVYYRDQGWGNKKTDVFFCCDCGASVQAATNCVSLCGTNVRNWRKCDFDKSVPSACNAGSSTCVAYRVGGGGGHRFYGRDFNAKVHYKSALLEALEIRFDGMFQSELEIVYEQTGYMGHVAVGLGGILAGLAGAFYFKKTQSIQYEPVV